MSDVTTVGIDLAKNVFSLHGVDAEGTVVMRCSVVVHDSGLSRSVPRRSTGCVDCLPKALD